MVLGLDLTNAPIGTSSGVGGMVFPVRFAQVELRLSDGLEFRTWPAVMGFTTAPMRRILLGIAHGLEFFTATFHGDRHEVELEVNASYPGS